MIPPHWDKDEVLREETGLWVFPAVSTVTYLSDAGAPTAVFGAQVGSYHGQVLNTEDPISEAEQGSVANLPLTIRQAWVSYPKTGKHFSFDGRLLHAVLPQLLRQKDSEQCSPAQKRVTFLVNVWINHKPKGCRPLPKTVIESCLAPGTADTVFDTVFDDECPPPTLAAASCNEDPVVSVPFGYLGHALEFIAATADDVSGDTYQASQLLRPRLKVMRVEPHVRKRPRRAQHGSSTAETTH